MENIPALSPIELHDLYRGMKKIERQTWLVLGIYCNCQLQGQERPDDGTLDYYQSIFPTLMETLDRTNTILDQDISLPDRRIRAMVSSIRELLTHLDYVADILHSWLEDRDDGLAPASPDPIRPSGTSRRKFVHAA